VATSNITVVSLGFGGIGEGNSQQKWDNVVTSPIRDQPNAHAISVTIHTQSVIANAISNTSVFVALSRRWSLLRCRGNVLVASDMGPMLHVGGQSSLSVLSIQAARLLYIIAWVELIVVFESLQPINAATN
jgi:hypothetical protein